MELLAVQRDLDREVAGRYRGGEAAGDGGGVDHAGVAAHLPARAVPREPLAQPPGTPAAVARRCPRSLTRILARSRGFARGVLVRHRASPLTVSVGPRARARRLAICLIGADKSACWVRGRGAASHSCNTRSFIAAAICVAGARPSRRRAAGRCVPGAECNRFAGLPVRVHAGTPLLYRDLGASLGCVRRIGPELASQKLRVCADGGARHPWAVALRTNSACQKTAQLLCWDASGHTIACVISTWASVPRNWKSGHRRRHRSSRALAWPKQRQGEYDAPLPPALHTEGRSC